MPGSREPGNTAASAWPTALVSRPPHSPVEQSVKRRSVRNFVFLSRELWGLGPYFVAQDYYVGFSYALGAAPWWAWAGGLFSVSAVLVSILALKQSGVAPVIAGALLMQRK